MQSELKHCFLSQRSLRRLTRTSPNFFEENPINVINKVGINYYNNKIFDVSKIYFTKSLKIKENYTAFLYLGILHKDDLDKSLYYFKQALELNINSQIIKNCLIIINLLIDKYKYDCIGYIKELKFVVDKFKLLKNCKDINLVLKKTTDPTDAFLKVNESVSA